MRKRWKEAALKARRAVCQRAASNGDGGLGESSGARWEGSISTKIQEVFGLGGRTTRIRYMIIFEDIENTGIKEYFW